MSECADKILSFFEQLNVIPRCSHNEAKVCQWLQGWADQRQYAHVCDAGGNLVVRVPGSAGYASAPTVVLQGHMDMVCEKTPESSHNFDKDPIVSHQEGQWLTAGDTTLGADNGIAIAYMMAIAEDTTLSHPPLELLFTVDEETGLNGAKALQPEFIKGRALINLDSEDEGIFTVGCAGGMDTSLERAFKTAPMDSKLAPYRLTVGGLKGGHSGIDIHKQRGNANKFLARTLKMIHTSTPINLISMQGGSRKNAIPRDAQAVFGMDASAAENILQSVAELEATLKAEHANSDAALFLRMAPASADDATEDLMHPDDSMAVVDLLLALPDGVVCMSAEMKDLVETSCNLATVALKKGTLTVLTSQRSAVMSRLEDITARVHAVARLSGASIKDHDDYPAWQPDMDSPLLQRSKNTYQRLFGKAPTIQVIHAGLECAIIGDIYTGMDMISFGPTIRNPHSPDECLFIPSVEKVWEFLAALLASTGSETEISY